MKNVREIVKKNLTVEIINVSILDMCFFIVFKDWKCIKSLHL